ncbi:hypothetical protein AZSI13_29080 [Azospira sp. I13]|nr:hypothetical protein AZSI13_29080 [Azospira sp. I13]
MASRKVVEERATRRWNRGRGGSPATAYPIWPWYVVPGTTGMPWGIAECLWVGRRQKRVEAANTGSTLDAGYCKSRVFFYKKNKSE